MTVSNLFTDNSFYFDAFTDISGEINIMLRRLVDQKNQTIKNEDDHTELKIEIKYEIDDLPPPPKTITIEYDLNNERESVVEKSKRISDTIKPTLETATQTEITDADRKKEQELNDKEIVQILSEETDNPQIDGKIENVFIDDNERFYKDDLIKKDKEFLHELVDKSNYSNIDFETDSDNIDFEIEQIPKNSDDDITYVKYVPPPPDSPVQPPLHKRGRLKRKIKILGRKKKGIEN